MQPELERLAREAGLPDPYTDTWCKYDGWSSELERFAMLVEQRAKADERERCAIVCDNVASDPFRYGFECRTAAQLAAAIRSSAPRSTGGEG